jgi:putative membrane protein
VNQSTHDPIDGTGQEGARLHISGLFVGFVSGLPQLLIPVFAAVFGARKSDNPALIPLIIAAVLILSLFFRWLIWLRFRYHVGADDIRVEKGLLNRTARSIPYERIQDVSIEQKPLARMMGLSEVKFETGGGDGDDATLRFVTLEEANRLRALIRARKAGVAVAQDVAPMVEAEDAETIFAMDGQRVFILGLYSFSLIIFAVLGGLAQQFDFLLPFDYWDLKRWAGLAVENGVSVNTLNGVGILGQLILAFGAFSSLIFIGLASGVVRTYLREHGFRLTQTSKGFRRQRGLLTLTDVAMPTHRVQAAVVQTGPIRKRRGWHSLKFVSLAQDSKEESNYVAAPLATLDEVWRIAAAAGRAAARARSARAGCARPPAARVSRTATGSAATPRPTARTAAAAASPVPRVSSARAAPARRLARRDSRCARGVASTFRASARTAGAATPPAPAGSSAPTAAA